jgi:hypothetical protein
LKDKEVKDNLYLEIFYVWLAKVIQSGGLTENDVLQVTMDQRTCEYLETYVNILPILLKKLPCSFVTVIVEPPSNPLEGMMNKYLITDYSQDTFIYCDIDILISSSFHKLDEKLLSNTIYVCKEGILGDDNHSGSYSSEITNKTLTGFSAGKFIVVGKELRDSFFKTIQEFCDYSTKFYTVEQPFFNRAVYKDTSSMDVTLLTEHVAFNGIDYVKGETIFNDMAGDVGIGESHVKRIINAITLYLCGDY